MTIIEALVAEHAAFCALFDQIERALPALNTLAEAKLLGRLVEGVLEGHADAETNLAYAALDHALEHRGQLDHLYRDHLEIDAQLKAVLAARDLSEARCLLQAAVKAARDHFDREERTVFRLIPEVLRHEALAELGAAWTLQRRPLAGQMPPGLMAGIGPGPPPPRAPIPRARA